MQRRKTHPCCSCVKTRVGQCLPVIRTPIMSSRVAVESSTTIIWPFTSMALSIIRRLAYCEYNESPIFDLLDNDENWIGLRTLRRLHGSDCRSGRSSIRETFPFPNVCEACAKYRYVYY